MKILQNRAIGVHRASNKNSNNTLPKNTRILRAEDLVFGTMLNLRKKYPSPRFTFNPFVKVDLKTGKFILDKEDQDFINALENKLSKKFEDNELAENVLGDMEIKD